MINIIKKYVMLVNSVPHIIEISGYRNDYIAKKMGLNPQSFSSKKQRNNWAPEEIEKLLTIIMNEDVEEYMDEQLHDEAIAKGGTPISSEEFEKRMGW